MKDVVVVWEEFETTTDLQFYRASLLFHVHMCKFHYMNLEFIWFIYVNLYGLEINQYKNKKSVYGAPNTGPGWEPG